MVTEPQEESADGRAVYTGTEEKKKSKGEVRQVSYGQDAKVREMRRAETILNIIEDQGKLYEAKVKETRKPESRMMRQVSSPVRRRAGGKGRKTDLARSLSSFTVLGVLFLGEVSPAFLPSKKACWTHQFRHFWVRQQGVGHMTVDTCGKLYLPTLHTAFKAQRMSAETRDRA